MESNLLQSLQLFEGAQLRVFTSTIDLMDGRETQNVELVTDVRHPNGKETYRLYLRFLIGDTGL